MTPKSAGSTWLREELLQLLALSATLAGLCITAVTLLRTLGKSSMAGSVADDALALSALLFLLNTYALFFALRTRHTALARTLEKLADAIFLAALTGMVGAGFVMVYTVW